MLLKGQLNTLQEWVFATDLNLTFLLFRLLYNTLLHIVSSMCKRNVFSSQAYKTISNCIL